jgi:Tol biopolymer transport system component
VGGGGGKRLWIRRLDDLTAKPMPGTDGAAYPFWSPDGASVAFFATNQLKRLDLEQGSVITVAGGLDSPRGGAWGRDGVMIFPTGYGTGLFKVSESGGGTPTPVTVLDSTMESTHRFPQFMPDGKHFIYLSANHSDEDGDSSAICYASIEGGKPVRLFASRSSAIYTNGFLLFVRDSTLMAQEFDPAGVATRGEPRATREVVQLDGSTWNAPITASDNGLLVYGLGGRAGNHRIVWYDRSGAGKRNLTGYGNFLSLDIAPGGGRIVFEWQQRPLADLWTLDIVTGTRSRITTHPEDENSGCWSPDGKQLVYCASRGWHRFKICTIRADGSGEEREILRLPDKDCWPLDVAADGRRFLYGIGIAAGTQIGSLCLGTLDGDIEPNIIVPESGAVLAAQFSPDDRWIAFDASLSGRGEVYVAPVPAPGEGLAARWQVSAQGGRLPRWRQDGRELFYVRPDGMIMSIAVDGSGGEFEIQGETALFQAFQRTDTQTFDASADGQSFVINTLGGNEGEPLAIVSNWMQTLVRK